MQAPTQAHIMQYVPVLMSLTSSYVHAPTWIILAICRTWLLASVMLPIDVHASTRII